ncbi:MAG: hypothetical protein PUI24_00105 [Spirochaetales bacterium]|nr:hypothetical protein [Spirochaetales bacterium]
MSPKIKNVISLIVSFLVSCMALFFVSSGGFNFIEVKFYEPRVLENINAQIESIQKFYDSYFQRLNDDFSSYVSKKFMASYFDRETDEAEEQQRVYETGVLFEKNPGLEGMRVIENDGIHIHYSTYREDIFKEDNATVSYKNYNTVNDIPFDLLQSGFVWDAERNRLIFSYNFSDSFDVNRGTFVFYISGDDFTRCLVAADIVPLNTRGYLVDEKGIIFNLPGIGRDSLAKFAAEKWQHNIYGVEALASDENITLFVVSKKSASGLSVGWVVPESDFSFTSQEKMLLMVCIFITVFLIVFLIFNIRHDDFVVINSRIRKFQYTLLREYIDRKDTFDWNTMAKEISRRKMEVNDEIKKSLGSRGRRHSKEVDELLDKSWSQVMGALAGNISITQINPVHADEKIAADVAEAEELEMLDAADDVTEAEAVEEIPAAEELEPLEELEEAEPLEEAKPAEAEELEPLEEAEPAEAEELEPLEDAEPAEAEELEPLEEVSEPETTDKAQTALSDSNDSNSSEVEIQETTLEEFLAEENLLNKRDENAEKRKYEAERNFSVESLDFSELDNGSKEE